MRRHRTVGEAVRSVSLRRRKRGRSYRGRDESLIMVNHRFDVRSILTVYMRSGVYESDGVSRVRFTILQRLVPDSIEHSVSIVQVYIIIHSYYIY